MKVGPLAAGLLTTVFAAASAHAAIAPACLPATMAPAKATLIPANIPGFAYNALAAKATDVHLSSIAGSAKTPLAVTIGEVANDWLKVVPAAALVPGTQYELAFETFCSYAPYPTKPIVFTATPEAPLPTKLGDLQTRPSVTVKDFGTSQFTISATFALAPELVPWRAVYDIGLVVDGRTIETQPTFVNDTVSITAVGWCDAAMAAKTQHTVQLRGVLPFAPTVETTASEIDFACPAPNIQTPAETAVAPTPNGSSTPVAPSSSSSSGGCHVGRTSARDGAIVWALVALGSAAGLRRSRRRA